MAKKAKTVKPAKKAAKPAKKAVAKKPATKAAPKKAAKPAKKAAPKKVVKKTAPKKAAKPAKKVIAKKPVKKVVAKKVTKPVVKAVAKKIVKPVKKVVAKKAAKPSKQIIVKKAVKKEAPKKAVKEVKKVVAKPIAKPVAKAEVKKAAPAKPVAVAKSTPPAPKKAKKQDYSIDSDEDNNTTEEAPMVVEYKTPSMRKPMGPAPIPHINDDKRTRYTDPELKEFKQLIIKKLTEAQKDYELLKSTLSHRDDHGTDDTSPTFKLLEDGSDVLSKEETAHLAGRQEKFIQNLQNALIRIENKTYGICRATGKLISKERLRSVPHATLAIEAKLVQKS